MPLFFMVFSFVLFNPSPEQAFKDKVYSLIKSILVLYVIFNKLLIILYKVIDIVSESVSTNVLISTCLCNRLYSYYLVNMQFCE